MSLLSERRRVCLLSMVGMLLVLLALASSILWPWWKQMRAYSDQARQTADRIARYQYLIERKPVFEEQLQEIGKQKAATGYLIVASDPDLAAAQLQRRIKVVTKEHGASLSSTQNLPDSGDGEKGRIVIRARITGDVEALAGVLHTLEGGRPLLTIENLSIRSRQKRGRRRGKNAQTGYDLNVNMDVVGYMQGGGQ